MSVADLPGEVRVGGDPDHLADMVAQWVAEQAAGADPFRIAVSGGSTPRALFERLATRPLAEAVPWTRWHVFFVDERAVGPDDPHSNFGMARDALLARVAIPASQVHRMEGEQPDLDAAAAEYASVLAADAGTPPRLDLVLLGLGADGHTASLFPGTPALHVTDAWVTRGRAPVEPTERLTLTLPVINGAGTVAFLVTGSSKGDALRGVIDGRVPAAHVRPGSGALVWFLDDEAAASLG